MSSWVKVSRKLLTSAIASKPEYLAVWMHLLLSASYKPGEILVGHQIVRLQAGQLVFGRVKFSQQIGVSEHTLRMALKTLETLQQITIKSHSKFSVISITNWTKYQEDSPANHQQSTSNQPATHHNKEIQEIQEEIKSSIDPSKPGRSKSAKKSDDPVFEAAWKLYPARDGSNPKNKAFSAWKARIAEGEDSQAMVDGLARYAAYCKAKGSLGTVYVMQAARFFGTSKEYQSEWSASAGSKQNGKPSIHHGFDNIDYKAGLVLREDGTYGL